MIQLYLLGILSVDALVLSVTLNCFTFWGLIEVGITAIKLDVNGESKCEESKTFAGRFVFGFVDTPSFQIKYSLGCEFEVYI